MLTPALLVSLPSSSILNEGIPTTGSHPVRAACTQLRMHRCCEVGGTGTYVLLRVHVHRSLPLWWENCVISGQSGSGSSRGSRQVPGTLRLIPK